jgi:hypothetical protein
MIKTPTVLLLGHKARHGKDTLAQALIEADPVRCRRYAFANAVKLEARLRGWMKEKNGALLQKIGAGYRNGTWVHDTIGPVTPEEVQTLLRLEGSTHLSYRRGNPNVWINVVAQQIAEEKPAIAILSDVRYQNEADWGKDHNGLVFDIQRIRPDGSLFVDPTRPADHSSEVDLDTYAFDEVFRIQEGDLNRFAEVAKRILANVQ